jgi:ATP/maltotriose-dependent transcriptional regulator MalT
MSATSWSKPGTTCLAEWNAELGGDVRAMIAGYVIASRLKLTEGDIETAAELLELARPLVEQAPFPEWISRFERCQVELWLRQGRLRAAVDWADARARGGAIDGRPVSEVAQLAMARVLIVKGDAPSREHALALFERLLQVAEAEGRMGISIEALLGFPLARLLQEARSRDVLLDYVAKLLAVFSTDLAIPSLAEQVLPEPLTHREQEILELVAAGLMNREIAD